MQFTPEMAERLARAQRADLLRRAAKLRRLNPEAHPATNLFAPWLDYEEGDPERCSDFYDQAKVAFANEMPSALGRISCRDPFSMSLRS